MMRLLIVLALVFASTRAHAQSDLDVVTNTVPPNVMVLLDNSGSMAHVMWHDDFNPRVFYDLGAVGTQCDNIGSVPAIEGSDGLCPGSGDAQDRCPDNDSRRDSGFEIGRWRHACEKMLCLCNTISLIGSKSPVFAFRSDHLQSFRWCPLS